MSCYKNPSFLSRPLIIPGPEQVGLVVKKKRGGCSGEEATEVLVYAHFNTFKSYD